LWVALELAGGVDEGTLPAPAPGVRMDLRVGYRRAAIVLGLARWARVERRDADGKGMRASAWQARVAAAFRATRSFELSAYLDIGQIEASGEGIDTVIDRTLGSQGLGASLGWRQPILDDLEFTCEVEVVWPFVRPNFVVDGREMFSPGLSGRGWLALAWRFL
jgi:hypothetical protein